MINNTWMLDGNCAGKDPGDYDLDVLKKRGMTAAMRRTHAHAVCAGCPVVARCAADAIRTGDNGTIRGGEPLPFGISRPNMQERLRYAVTTGKVPELSDLEKARLRGEKMPRPIRDCDRERNDRWNLIKKQNRWESRKCDRCLTPVKSETLPEDVWPERALAADPGWRTHLCQSCADLDSQQREHGATDENAHTIKLWQRRACRWCMQSIRPMSLPEYLLPGRVEAFDPDTCIKCYEARVKTA